MTPLTMLKGWWIASTGTPLNHHLYMWGLQRTQSQLSSYLRLYRRKWKNGSHWETKPGRAIGLSYQYTLVTEPQPFDNHQPTHYPLYTSQVDLNFPSHTLGILMIHVHVNILVFQLKLLFWSLLLVEFELYRHQYMATHDAVGCFHEYYLLRLHRLNIHLKVFMFITAALAGRSAKSTKRQHAEIDVTHDWLVV